MVSDQKATSERVADRLIEMGYLKFVPESEKAIARQELIASLDGGVLSTQWQERSSRDRRGYFADSEELAEGRAGKLLLLMRDVLSLERVQFNSVEDNIRVDGYDLVID